jgi:HD-like signal output (HDOD) protein
MPEFPESGAQRPRQDLPLETVLGPLRDVLEAVAQAQRQSEEALQRVIERLDGPILASVSAASAPALPDAVAQAIPPGEPAVATAAPPIVAEPTPTVPPATPPVAADRTLPPSPDTPRPSLDTDSDPRLAVRRMLASLQRAANEIDRLVESETIDAYLWQRAQQTGLRGLRLLEKGRARHAEDSFGFVNFEGERQARLRKVVVPFDPDGLFGVTAQERAVYSGPRPAKGLPVDLVLVMGKQAPVWCMVVPMPYRNRWGGFLYFEAMAEGLESILELELVARLAVLQLRAARFRPHEPAERVRNFRASTLRDRRQRRARGAGPSPLNGAAADPGTEPDAPDPLSRKRGVRAVAEADAPRLLPPEPDRFDASGHLVRPLDGTTILARMGELPPMPHVATRLIGLLNDPQTEISTLQEIMATDQAISVRLLQIANSSLYGSMREVSTIAEAVMRLGFTAIRSWLLATVTRVMFTEGSSNVHRHRLWRQSVLAGIAAQEIAGRTGRMDPETAFMGGLLQNIGLLLLARNHPDVFEAIDEHARADQRSYFESERVALGFDHADLGGLILQKWGLGETLIDAVNSHHRLESAGSAIDFAAIIALAEELALRVGEGPTETSDGDLALGSPAQHLGMDAAAIEAVADVVGQRALDRALFEH